jgi:hypothetical protein
MVSTWASANNLVLAQRKTDAKSNDITAIPQLLAAQQLSGTVVTIDAIGCQKAIAQQIVTQQADYILAVKENQPSLLADIKGSFQMLAADNIDEQIDCGHGRVERCRCSVVADLSLLDHAAEWAQLSSLVRIQAERYHKATGKTQAGIYPTNFLYTSNRGATISIDVNGKDATGPLQIPTTYVPAAPVVWRQWHHWNLASQLSKVALSKERYVLTVDILTGGNLNLAYFDFKQVYP